MDFIAKYIVSSIFVCFGVFILITIYGSFRKKNYNVVPAKIIKCAKYNSSNTTQGHAMKYGVTLEYEFHLMVKSTLINPFLKMLTLMHPQTQSGLVNFQRNILKEKKYLFLLIKITLQILISLKKHREHCFFLF